MLFQAAVYSLVISVCSAALPSITRPHLIWAIPGHVHTASWEVAETGFRTKQPAPETVHSTSFRGQAAPAWWALKPYSLLALDSEDALLHPRRHVLLSLLVRLVLLQAQLKGVPLCAPWPAVLQQKWFEFLNLCVYLFPQCRKSFPRAEFVHFWSWC